MNLEVVISCFPVGVTFDKHVCGKNADKAWSWAVSGHEASGLMVPLHPLHPLPLCLAVEALKTSPTLCPSYTKSKGTSASQLLIQVASRPKNT